MFDEKSQQPVCELRGLARSKYRMDRHSPETVLNVAVRIATNKINVSGWDKTLFLFVYALSMPQLTLLVH